MTKHKGRRAALTIVEIVILAVLVFGLLVGPFGPAPNAGGIRNSLLYFTVAEGQKSIRPDLAVPPQPMPHVPVPQHPFMAANAGNNMHDDAYMTDTSEARGPLGPDLQVQSKTQGFGGYGTIAFDRRGRLVGVYSNGRRFQLELMDARTLVELAAYDLPPRPADFILEGTLPWEYIGAGMYFYLDHLDRAVVPTTANTVQVVQVPDLDGQQRFELVREYDLADYVVPMARPQRDSVAWVLPDWSGRTYWYATTGGMVGAVDVETGRVHTHRLEGEIVENSFAVAEDGVYIISDRALYRLTQDESGAIVAQWRTEYDRGPRAKPGVITRGSGTSVTLIGRDPGVVAITDNAAPQVHLLYVRRSDGQVLCRVPLFEPGRSATDITVAGFQVAAGGRVAAIAENNWSRHVFPFANPQPGISRVDLVPLTDGSFRCDTVWSSGERNLGVFKASPGSGLLYLYGGEGPIFNQRWYLTALDLASGQTVYKQLAGTGLGYDNWAGALFIHPAGGVAYSTTIFGLVMIREESSPRQ